MGSDFIHSSEMVDNVSEKTQFYVGLERCIEDLKVYLFDSQVSVVGVHGMAGGGKTTLALALCNDIQVKDYFHNNVIFVRVSQSPDLKGILETVWEKIAGRKRPEFKDVENVHMELQQLILSQSNSILIILDDVCSINSLEKLLFEVSGCKTLITTRDKSIIPTNSSTQLFQLPLLGPKDALSLFCFWATGQTSISSDTDANIMQEVQAKCDGLPLALKVIGSSLHGEPHEVWKNKLSKGEYISDYEKKGLFRSLQTNIDSLEDVTKECFLDLAIFPQDRKICADALLDIWVYVRKLEKHNAFAILSELANKNLLKFTSKSRGSKPISYENASELYISQHNVMRDLVSYLAHKDNTIHSKRLVITRMECGLLSEGELINDSALDTQILSVLTEPMEENHWHAIDFPKTEALLLAFTSREYILPLFLKSMKKLKFLMVFNCCTKKATVKGLEVLSSLPQLKSIRLERLISPLGGKQSIEELQSIEKISLSLCEGFRTISTFDTTKLQHFNLDHSSDLEELPVEICNMPSALSWSITNCHLLQNLPYDLGNMSHLRILRLSALPGLKELPVSIGKLEELEYLDISVCERLKQLPKEIGQLKKLREFDMRECSRLRRLPTTVCELSCLKLVVCDEKIGKQWMRAKNISIPELRVEIVEAHFSLDWLDD
ncbi:probable disease resistance protein At4g33300 [Cryptomeria japonica]|uniref:probable disease resistance protein At4g33300 n=1 Tax=Cryptomeria japonica TaxID=3369 RepID=UPI0027DA96E0|nr:probable disease resistance protein At4g33300 [Cryptomeria japonica]